MTEYSVDYRSNCRLIITLEDLATKLFERIKHLFPEVIITSDGIPWKIVGLNERFRFCRYTPGQLFKPHNDSCFPRSLHEKSFLTFMIYLNGGFEGGNTNFLAKDYKVIKQVVPEAGMVLVFSHKMLHEGEKLTSSKKYLMRSDVMYAKQQTEETSNAKRVRLSKKTKSEKRR